jgi:ABC-type phosphate/phosphonate transport system substrate-binding protein
MPLGLNNREERNTYRPWSYTRVLLAADAPSAEAAVAAKVGFTIYVTKIAYSITTASGKTTSLQDTAGTPVVFAAHLSTATATGPTVWDFGEEGIPLTADKGFTLTVSAAGDAGIIYAEGYYKQTSALTLAQLASS